MILAGAVTGDDIVGAIVAVLMLAYLAYALIRPEKL